MQHAFKTIISHSLMKMCQVAEHEKTVCRPKMDTRGRETDRKNKTATETDAPIHATE